MLMQRRMVRMQQRHKWLQWLDGDRDFKVNARRYRTVKTNTVLGARVERFMQGPTCVHEMIYDLIEYTSEPSPDPNAKLKRKEGAESEEEATIGLNGEVEEEDFTARLKQRQDELARREAQRNKQSRDRPRIDVELSDADLEAVRNKAEISGFGLNLKKIDAEGKEIIETAKFQGKRVEFDDE